MTETTITIQDEVGRMKPYYDHAGITIYHGDCREVLPGLGKVDLVLTDPPWIASKAKAILNFGGGVAATVEDSFTLPGGSIGDFDSGVLVDVQGVATHDCLFIVGYKELGIVCSLASPLRGVFGWHKRNGSPAIHLPAKLDLAFIVWTGQASLLYGHQHWSSSVFSYNVPNAGCISNGERILESKNGKAAHPAQGPVALYRELLKPFDDVTVLDPYMGTGTTLRAAKDHGLRAIGCEIEERYCEIAANRLQQEVFEFDE
jgi:hypothetical protein